MVNVEACRIGFQCPQCGHELEQTIGKLKSQDRMICPGCGIGINIDASRLSNVVEEIRQAVDKSPSEITIKFYR
jgi:transcription elongation factor Elf1